MKVFGNAMKKGICKPQISHATYMSFGDG